MDTFDAIARRTSIRDFRTEPVSRALIERLLDAAVRAPNHKLTQPWRFAVVTGATKERYAQIRKAHRAEKVEGDPQAEAKIAKTYREHADTPAFVFVLQALSDDAVRREEDYAAVMMATENLMLAATALGLGTYLKTGGIMDRPEVRELVGAGEKQRVVGIVAVGYGADEGAQPVRRTPSPELTTWLD